MIVEDLPEGNLNRFCMQNNKFTGKPFPGKKYPQKTIPILIFLMILQTGCNPVIDFWKKSQQYMYIQQGMYVVDSIQIDTLLVIKENV